jgi:IS5 family transposase
LEKKKDPDSQWGKSTTKGWVLGFKFHILSDIHLGLPLRLEVTPANKHESPQLPKLVKGVGKGDYIMDSGFDSERNHLKIAAEGGFPAICRNRRRKGKPKKTLRNKLRKSKRRKRLLRKRWVVEPVNELFKSVLKLPTRLFKGIESVMFYAQLTLMRLLVQALWAYNIRQPQLARVTTYFKHR